MINLLNKEVINQIAAGEVVERPASIVKELLENSIDAGAKKLRIITKNAGLDTIAVHDDGLGIEKKDLQLLFTNHATSKISKLDDLSKHWDYGFRGEALASISSVSKINLKTINSGELEGYEVNYENGKMSKPIPSSIKLGTQMTVGNLFYNVPARKKFLKVKSTENKYIIDYINKFILSNPEIDFDYEVDNSKKRFLPSDLGERFSQISRIDKSKFIQIDYKDSYLKLTGCLIHPKELYASKKSQYLFVNNRSISDPILYKAIKEGYREFAMKEANLSYIVFVEVNPSQVDVNVHPRKTEIKFTNPQKVFVTVKNITKQLLLTKLKQETVDQVASIKQSTEEPLFRNISTTSGEGSQTNEDGNQVVSEHNSNEKNNKDFKSFLMEDGLTQKNDTQGKAGVGELIDKKDKQLPEQKVGSTTSSVFANTKSGVTVNTALEFSKNVLDVDDTSKIKYDSTAIMQFLNSYIVCQTNTNSILIIDQHAASERIFYEKYLKQLKEGKVVRKELLFPKVFSMDSSEKAVFLKFKKKVQNMGFCIEDFGLNGIKITSVPELHYSLDLEKFFHEIVSDLEENDEIRSSIDKFYKKLASSYACHTAVRFGDKMTNTELQKLLQDLVHCENPYNCPDGRPIIQELSKHQLERMFKRIV